MKLKKSLFLSFILGLFPLHALIEETLDPKSTIEVVLSTTSPNRIMVDGGVITDIILDENKFERVLHPKTGQAFLTPKEIIENTPSAVTLITGCGESQTLQVFAKEKVGEVIILKEKEETSSPSENTSFDYHSSTVSFLNDLLWGNIPQGYGIRPMEEEVFPMHPPFTGKVLRVLEGPFEKILIVEIQNRSKRVETLKPSSLKQEKDFWVFIAKTHLEPLEKGIVILSSNKDF